MLSFKPAFSLSSFTLIKRLSSLQDLLLLLLLLGHFSRVRLCATPEMAAHQAPPSLGFSRQEHWSGLPFPSPMHESESEVTQSCPTLRPHGLQPTRLLRPWDFPGKSTGVGCQLPLNLVAFSPSRLPLPRLTNLWSYLQFLASPSAMSLSLSGFSLHSSLTIPYLPFKNQLKTLLEEAILITSMLDCMSWLWALRTLHTFNLALIVCD